MDTSRSITNSVNINIQAAITQALTECIENIKMTQLFEAGRLDTEIRPPLSQGTGTWSTVQNHLHKYPHR